MPGRLVLLVEFIPDELGSLYVVVDALKGLSRDFYGVLLHVIRHVSVLHKRRSVSSLVSFNSPLQPRPLGCHFPSIFFPFPQFLLRYLSLPLQFFSLLSLFFSSLFQLFLLLLRYLSLLFQFLLLLLRLLVASVHHFKGCQI